MKLIPRPGKFAKFNASFHRRIAELLDAGWHPGAKLGPRRNRRPQPMEAVSNEQ